MSGSAKSREGISASGGGKNRPGVSVRLAEALDKEFIKIAERVFKPERGKKRSGSMTKMVQRVLEEFVFCTIGTPRAVELGLLNPIDEPRWNPTFLRDAINKFDSSRQGIAGPKSQGSRTGSAK